MANHTIIKLRRGTAAQWQLVNEILKLGEPGFEKDTFKLKIGDGITAWNNLPYITGGFGGDNGPLEYVYDIDMGSNSATSPEILYFDSRSNYVDYSNFYNYIIENNNTVSLKLTSKNNPNNFFIAAAGAPTKQTNVGSIDAFWPSSSIQWISDGGDDQYDSANFINNNITTPVIPTSSPSSTTLRTTSIPYNSGRIASNSQYWGSNDYVTLYKKNIFAMVAKGNALTMPNTVYYAGNTGADGSGDKDIGSLSNYNGYQAGYCRIWGNDPTFTKLIISKVGTIPTYTTDTDNDTNDDLFVASGLNSDTIAMVVFYADDNSNPSNLSDIQTLFESFVDNILITASDIEQINTNFNTSIDNVYSSVDPSFWYDNFEFFTGTNGGNANFIDAEGGSGSNLQFSVTVNQDTRQYDISINNSGSNYQNGDIVVLRGDELYGPNGRSPDEDIYIIITSVDTGGEVLLFNTIINFTYNFTIDKILSRADGFRFNDGEAYYLNIDMIGGSGDITTIGNIDLHNGGVQIAEILQFTDKDYQSVITGPTPDSDTNAQRLIIQGQKGQGTGEGGDVYVWGGDADTNGGDIKIYAGDADNGASGYGGYVNIDGGDGYDQGGSVSVNGGNSSTSGGDVNLTGGAPDGVVNIASNNGSYNWVFNETGELQLSTNGLVFSDTSTQTTSATNIVNDALNTNLIAGDGIDLNYSSPNLTISQESINNYADNRLLTSNGTTTGIDAESNLTFDGSTLTVTGDVSANYYFGDFDGPVVYDCKNNTASSISKGTPVYISGHFANGKVYVEPARADNASKMPAFGLLGVTLAPGDEGHVHVFGVLSNIDTQTPGYTIGQVLYIGPTGGLTSTRPTGESELIQNIGRVARVHNSNGRIIILGPGRSNDVPNSISSYKLDIDNIRIDSNTISSTNSNGNIVLAPNGTGDVQVDADTLRVGDSNTAATITTNGTGNLVLNTNAGTNSGSITIAQGSNGNITIAPNGTGDVYVDADTLRVGDSGATATVTTNGAGNLVLNTNSGTNSGSITIAQGADSNITVATNGNGDIHLDADSIRIGDTNIDAYITTNGTGNLTLNTNSGTDSGSITIEDGVDGNIVIIPNGDGKIGINNNTPFHRLDVIGDAKFTQVYPTVVSNGTVNGNVGTDVSIGQIFDMTLDGATTLTNPTNPVDGVTIRWRITQDGTGGHAVTLGSEFQIPSSATSPLPWSTAAGATDILAATYHAGRVKWDVVAFVPGY